MKEYPENEFIQLSALQHMLFCERQCALIHVEQLWAENRFTAEGLMMHPFLNEKVEIGNLFFIQALLPARFIRGNLDGLRFYFPGSNWKRRVEHAGAWIERNGIIIDIGSTSIDMDENIPKNIIMKKRPGLWNRKLRLL